MATHYTARLLLDTDERFRGRAAERNSDFIECWEIFLPRLLGALTFVAVLLLAERSIENLPVIDDTYVVAYVSRMLRWFQLVTLATLGIFICTCSAARHSVHFNPFAISNRKPDS